jgi:hypothetical protein
VLVIWAELSEGTVLRRVAEEELMSTGDVD